MTARILYLPGARLAEGHGGPSLHAQVIQAADGRCQCTGRCGAEHASGLGRCLIEHRQAGRPLLAVPRDLAVSLVDAVRLPAADLMALCARCDEGARREAAKLPGRAAPPQDALFGPGAL